MSHKYTSAVVLKPRMKMKTLGVILSRCLGKSNELKLRTFSVVSFPPGSVPETSVAVHMLVVQNHVLLNTEG